MLALALVTIINDVKAKNIRCHLYSIGSDNTYRISNSYKQKNTVQWVV